MLRYGSAHDNWQEGVYMAGFETVQKRVQELRSLLNYHSKRYYEEDAPEIEDYEYDQMLRELEELRRNLEKEEDSLEKEYLSLTSGKVLELSEELEKELDDLGIHTVYGMEWLKKNGYSQKKNQMLVRKNPFLPYALILTRQEIEKLGRNDRNVCTSFPVPIVEREKIEEFQEKYTDKIVNFPGISFYILFNENLLDEEKLQAMIWEKKKELEKLNQAVDQRKKEYAEYFQRQETLKNQSVTKEKWEEIQELLKTLEEEKKSLEKDIRDAAQELDSLKTAHEKLQNLLIKSAAEIDRQKQRLEDFSQLEKDYAFYENNRNELEKCKKDETRFRENQKLAKDRQEKLLEEKMTLEHNLNMLEREKDRLDEKYTRYTSYEMDSRESDEVRKQQSQQFGFASMSTEQMEARYEAITSVLSQELKNLEEQERRSAARYQREKEDLDYLQKKYHLKPEQWSGVIYDRKEESHQEGVLEDFRRKIQTKDMQWNDADKKAAVAQSKISELTKRIHSVCGMEKPLPKDEIQGQDFQARKNQLFYEKKEEKKESSDPSYTWMNFSPDKKYILYAKNHNLYVKGNKSLGVDTTEVQLTTDGMKDFSYAREDDYEPAEDGEVPTLARWCPDNRHVYAVRDDNRLLRDFWVINSIEDSPSLVKYKYEFPGDKYVTQNDLTIIDIVEKTAKKAKVDKWKDQYVMPLHVTSDSKYLFFERTKRTWDEVDVCSVNLSTLEVKEIIHEEDKPYRDPHARNVAILNDGKDILFRSERTGWGHYYHYDGDGNLKNVMTSGEWVTGYINSIDTLKRKVYLYGYGKDKKVNPFYYMLFEVDIDKEGVTPLSTEDGQHNVNFLKSHNYYIDTYSRVDMEPKIMLKDRKGKVIMELAKPDLDLVYASGWKKPERFVVKAADNITDLYGVMWKPSDFNPEKKYPIISVVYPGPYFGFVPTNFTLDDSYCTRMAQLGFIVITVGHRGDTPMRGKAYHRYGYGNMRDYPLADDKYAIEQLAQRHSFINGKKVGIYGHSGGGFMAAAAIFTYPDFYTAAVSCSGNHDNSIYNRGWGECYNGVKEVEKVVKDSLGNETKEYEYKFSVKSNAEIAKNLKGHLMLVTGDMDKNVNPAHTYRVAQALIEAGKDFDMLVIPGAGHGYGSADKYFEKKMYRFFAKHLLGDNRADYWGDINCTK